MSKSCPSQAFFLKHMDKFHWKRKSIQNERNNFLTKKNFKIFLSIYFLAFSKVHLTKGYQLEAPTELHTKLFIRFVNTTSQDEAKSLLGKQVLFNRKLPSLELGPPFMWAGWAKFVLEDKKIPVIVLPALVSRKGRFQGLLKLVDKPIGGGWSSLKGINTCGILTWYLPTH